MSHAHAPRLGCSNTLESSRCVRVRGHGNASSVTYLLTFIAQMLTRVLYIWALHHPASGYVQGINDLLTPFIAVFLSEYVSEYRPPTALQPLRL
eukprot:COSAG02_NODE_10023_length_2046_cov_1.370827_1_plen_94_part_00